MMKLADVGKEYISISGLVYSCQYHVVFTPKFRRKVLVDGIDIRLKELILEKQSEYQFSVLDMEVMPDHVHLLVSCNPKKGIYDIVNHIKGYTSHVLRNEFPALKKRIPTLWTRSKFISSVGAVTLDVVKRYIEDQKNV